MSSITESAKALMPKLSEIRRDFHMHPEVSQHEERTGKKVAEYLKAMGCDEVHENVGGYGVVGVIKGKKPGKVVALRADMDALQIQEMNEVPYKSQNDGVMHACGHDNHMTGLLGAAMLLCERRDEIAGTVKLIFQPAEEGVRGAKSIVDNGHLDGVDYLIGSHVTNKKEDDPAVVIPGSHGSLATTKYDLPMQVDHRRLDGMSCWQSERRS